MTAFTPAPQSPVRGSPEFRDQADAMANWWTVIMPQMQAFADSVDPLAAITPNIIAALNFNGSWASLAGALNMPASVYHNGQLWGLVQNLANVAAATPGVSAAWVALSGWAQVGSPYAVAGSPIEVVFNNIGSGGAAIGFEVDAIAPASGSNVVFEMAVSSNNGATWSAWLSNLTGINGTSLSTPITGLVTIENSTRGRFSLTSALAVGNMPDPGMTARTLNGTLVAAGRSKVNAAKFRWGGGAAFANTGSIQLVRRP